MNVSHQQIQVIFSMRVDVNQIKEWMVEMLFECLVNEIDIWPCWTVALQRDTLRVYGDDCREVWDKTLW